MLLSRHTDFQRINRQLRPRLLGGGGYLEDLLANQGRISGAEVPLKASKYSCGEWSKMISTCLRSAPCQSPFHHQNPNLWMNIHTAIASNPHPGSLIGIPSLVELHGSIVQQRMKHGRLVAAVVFLSRIRSDKRWGHGRSIKHLYHL